MKMFKNLINYMKLRNDMKETVNIINYAWLINDKKCQKEYTRRLHIINARLGNKYRIIDTLIEM